MKIYIHTHGDQILQVNANATDQVGQIVSQHGGGADARAWLENSDDPLEPTATLADAGVKERDHIQISKCRHLNVTVRYGGDSKSKQFPPGATIVSVFNWATGSNGFDLTQTEKAKHTLGICDTLTQPDKASHIGSFADEDCGVCLDLAPKERFEG